MLKRWKSCRFLTTQHIVQGSNIQFNTLKRNGIEKVQYDPNGWIKEDILEQRHQFPILSCLVEHVEWPLWNIVKKSVSEVEKMGKKWELDFFSCFIWIASELLGKSEGRVEKTGMSLQYYWMFTSHVWSLLMPSYKFWWLQLKDQHKQQQFAFKMDSPIIKETLSRADNADRSPLRDLLYSQCGSCPLASGQQSDGWRERGAVGREEEVSMNQWQAERCHDGR